MVLFFGFSFLRNRLNKKTRSKSDKMPIKELNNTKTYSCTMLNFKCIHKSSSVNSWKAFLKIR